MSFRWHWGHSIALIYTLFAASTVGFVVFAMEQRVDLVSDDYYEKSIALDARRAAEANVRALGADFTITMEAGAHTAVVQWPAPVVNNPTGTLTLYRPADATADRKATIAPDATHTQAVSLKGLTPGRWMLQVEWTNGGKNYYAEREVTVTADDRSAGK